MQVQFILPIAALRGKISSKSNYYFRTYNGKTYAQRCPKQPAPTPAQKAASELFAKRARLVAQMQREGTDLPLKQLWKLAKTAL
ncbi:MAG: hypothetical protein IJ047_00255 [Paludibacteraceae bacterium]|jgi:hypothetical protein|nr:hypothetical protein [Paludibacteraceae bacterium]